MKERERVPMPVKRGWITDEEVSLKIEPPLVGRRFNMDVSEHVLAQFGARAIEHVVERLGMEVAHEHQHEIHSMVATALLDKSWALPIIEDELRKAVRHMVAGMFNQ